MRNRCSCSRVEKMKNEEGGPEEEEEEEEREKKSISILALARLLLLELEIEGAPLEFGWLRSWSLGLEVLPFWS